MIAKINNKFFYYFSIAVSITIFLPIVYNNVPITRVRLFIVVLWFLSLFIMKPVVLRNKLFQGIVLYSIAMILFQSFLWSDITEVGKVKLIREILTMLIAVSIIAYYRATGDYAGLAFFIKWTFVFIIVTAVMSIITSILNPNYAREITALSALQSESGKEAVLSYKKYGGGTYSYATAIVAFFPLLIYYYRSMGYWGKRSIILFIVILFYTLIRIQIFANILFALLVLILSILGRKNLKVSLGIYGFIFLAFILIPMQFYVELLKYMGNWFERGSENYYKFNTMAQYLSQGGGVSESNTSIGVRAARYPVLWELFMKNPLWGSQKGNFHLFWMNKLAFYGVLGTFPLVFLIYTYIKSSLKYFNEEFSFYYLLSVFSIIALGFTKALVGYETWITFFVLIPGFYYLPLISKEKKLKSP